MQITKKGNEIIIREKLKKKETWKVFNGDKIKSFTVYKKPEIVIGYSNICADGDYILIIDYDNVDISVVREDYMCLQDKFSVTPAYLFETSENSYHVVCLEKFNSFEISNMLIYTRCDANFSTMPLRNPFRSWVLRISPKGKKKKPKLLGVLGKIQSLDYEISSAHLNFLKKMYPKLQKIDFNKEDNLTKLKINKYETYG